LMARRLDVSRLALVGDEVLVADQLYVSGPTSASGGFTVSENGFLAYQGGSGRLSQLRWLNRKGETLGEIGPPGLIEDVALSPNGTRVAVALRPKPFARIDLVTYDWPENVRNPLTFDPADEIAPVWAPDGRRVAFGSNRAGIGEIFVKALGGLGGEQRLLTGRQLEVPQSWSPDGHFILYASNTSETRENLRVLSTSDGTHRAFAETQFSETQGEFSPDGKWIVYTSTEPGLRAVYVAPFPGPGEKKRISSAGGQSPRWRHHGGQHEIFYVRGRNTMVATTVSLAGGRVQVIRETPLPIDMRLTVGLGRSYDVSRDGQRFLASQLLETAEQPVTLVVNWTAGLKK